jgi:type II secretory pathway component HofQ
MLKQAGFATLTLLVICASNSAFAQQPQPAVKPTVSGKPTPKKATRAIVVEKNAEDAAPTPAGAPAGAPADEAKSAGKPSAPVATVSKPADTGPPPAAEKPDIADKPAPVVKKPLLREKPIVRAKPRPQRPRYGYGGYY